jgi:ABC-type sugar transport system ATPase subunit
MARRLQLRRLPADEIRRKVGQILTMRQLDRLADRYPGEISGGGPQSASAVGYIYLRGFDAAAIHHHDEIGRRHRLV